VSTLRGEIASLDRAAAKLREHMPSDPTARVHRWERAGRGKAPFRVVGHYVAEPYQAVPGDPNCPLLPGAACDVCGQAISGVFRIRSADGREFKVGEDCVLKASSDDRNLRRDVNKVKTAARHAREGAKVEDVRGLLAREEVRAALAALPHPREWAAKQGRTLLDWAEWMMQNAGVRGKVEVGKVIAARTKEGLP